MSLISLGSSPALEDKISKLVAKGIPVVVAAGNFRLDACQFTPAKLPEVIAVGNVDNFDKVNFASNNGKCVDIYAPGTFIRSAAGNTNTGTVVFTGTSHSAPHVSGAIAQLFEQNSSYSPADIRRELLNLAARGVMDNSTLIGGAPNLLLQVET